MLLKHCTETGMARIASISVPPIRLPEHIDIDLLSRAMQRALIQYRNPKNYDLVYEALKKAGREDLIGFDKKCLIRPRNTGAKTWSKDVKTEKNAIPAKKKTIRNVHKSKAKKG